MAGPARANRTAPSSHAKFVAPGLASDFDPLRTSAFTSWQHPRVSPPCYQTPPPPPSKQSILCSDRLFSPRGGVALPPSLQATGQRHPDRRVVCSPGEAKLRYSTSHGTGAEVVLGNAPLGGSGHGQKSGPGSLAFTVSRRSGSPAFPLSDPPEALKKMLEKPSPAHLPPADPGSDGFNDLDDQFHRYFGTSNLASVPPEALNAGIEHMKVDLGLTKDRGERFALWALLHILGGPRSGCRLQERGRSRGSAEFHGPDCRIKRRLAWHWRYEARLRLLSTHCGH